MQGTNHLTMQSTYSTPCGWCTKWDKKCDKKIGELTKPYDYLKEAPTNQTCAFEADHEWEYSTISTEGYTMICKKCGLSKNEPFTFFLDGPTSTSAVKEIIENVVKEN